MPPGPMAKHPAARQRRNAPAATSREIVLRSSDDELLPVPELPERVVERKVDGEYVPMVVEWTDQAKVAWVKMWQYPLVYEAPEVDHALLHVYITLIDDFHRRARQGRAITEQANQIRAYAELWGIGEKARRHLQITIQDAEEAIDRGRKMHTRRFEQPAPEVTPTLNAPQWNEDDEDDGSILEAEVVE